MMTIDFAQARAIAEAEARKVLTPFAKARETYLRDDYAKGRSCWIFFRTRDIEILPEHSLTADWAYGISIWGDLRFVYDLSGDPIRMQEYVDSLSDFFREEHEKGADSISG